MLSSTFLVTNTNDGGPGSLRQAILDSNANPATTLLENQIKFSLAGSGVQTIAPLSPLPVVTARASITGPLDPVTNAPTIELDGENAGPFANGLVVGASASGFAMGAFVASSQITGLIINHFAKDGVALEGAIQGVSSCYIGTDASGTVAAGNGGNGITMAGAKDGVTRCVISANVGAGIVSSGGQSGIYGSFVGTNALGTAALGNGQEGIVAAGSDRIGNRGQPNVISANGSSGIVVLGPSAGGSIDQNNIGVTANGTAALPNGTDPLALYRDGITDLAPDVTIGQSINVISGNRGNGIFVGPAGTGTKIEENVIGTDASGSLPIGNGRSGIVLAGGNVSVGSFINALPGSPPTQAGGNVIAANGGDGILIFSSKNSLQQNYVGLTVVGGALGNAGNGVEIRGGDNNVIGDVNRPAGPFGRASNVISANGAAGVSIRTDSSGAGGRGNVVVGDYIGMNRFGNMPLGNAGNGVEVFASNNVIGGGPYLTENAIVGNGGSGVYLGDALGVPQSGNQVVGNQIGNSEGKRGGITPASNYGNARDGVTIYRSANNTIANNSIAQNRDNGVSVRAAVPGTSDSNQNYISRNYIDGNSQNGVIVFASSDNTVIKNTISRNRYNGVAIIAGTPAATDATGNRISGNSIFLNNRLGIDLGDDGVTPNHPGGAASGPNKFQNYPVILSASTSAGATTVRFMLDSPPGAYTIEFYSDLTPDPTGHGQGQQSLGSAMIDVATPGQIITAHLPGTRVGSVVTATATDASGNTSEFALDVQVSSPPAIVPVLDFSYLVRIARNFGQAGAPATGDLDGDGIVDFKDLVLLARSYVRPPSV